MSAEIDRLAALLDDVLAAHNATVGSAEIHAFMRKQRALITLSDAAVNALPRLLAVARAAAQHRYLSDAPTRSGEELDAALAALDR